MLFSPNDYLPVALFFDDSVITAITISHPRYSLELARELGGTWQIDHPSGAQIIVTLSDSRNSTTLRIVEGPSGHYRGTSDFHPGWYRLDAEMVKRLATFNPGALVDRHLMTFDPRSVEQVVIKLADNDYTVTRKENGWQWEKPLTKKAGSAAAWKLVFDIRDIQYQEQTMAGEAAAKNSDPCVIQDPDIVIEVSQEAAAAGKLVLKARQTRGAWLVTSSRLAGCYLVERTSLENLINYLETLVDKP